MQRLKMPEGEAIESSWVSRSIESAQRKVEAHNFDIRKQLLEYDDVANDQRKVIYEQRNELMESADVSETITSLRQGVVSDIFRAHIPPESVEEQWDVPGLEKAFAAELQFSIPVKSWLDADPSLDEQALLQKVVAEADRLYREKFSLAPAEALTRMSAGSCSTTSTSIGASTWRRWTTCARAYIFAAMHRRTRSRSISARRSSCFQACWRASNWK